jgi:hypothetical protein
MASASPCQFRSQRSWFGEKLPPPKRLTDTQLRGLQMPLFAALAGRSAMHNGAHAADVSIGPNVS